MGSSIGVLNDTKKVVIVGGSFGGRMITYGLQQCDTTNKLEITIVDKSAHFEYNCGNYKSICDDTSFKNLSETHEKIINSYNLNPAKIAVKFVQGRLDSINSDANTISLTDSDGKTSELGYDSLVLATGATYTSPWREGPEEMKTRDEREGDYTKVREEIKAAKSVLIVGAGATGLETAGYMKEKFPDHKIGICLRGNTLLPYLDGVHAKIDLHLKSMGLEIHYGTPYVEGETAAALGYDYALDCRGYKFTAPAKFMTGGLSKCVDKKNGQIQVNYFGQVCEKYPLSIDRKTNNALDVFKNIFSVGDVCLTPLAENKSIVAMMQYAPIVSHNIYQQLCGAPHCSKQIPEDIVVFQAIPLGTKSGIVCINNKADIKGDVDAMKDDIEKKTLARLRGDPKSLQEGMKEGKDMGNFFGMLKSTCCCIMCCGCCGCHYAFKRGKDRASVRKLKEEYEIKFPSGN